MLNTKQERAIFLLTAGISPITIAQELEITNEILHGWLQQPYFITALNNHKQACREANRNRLEYLFGRALNALDEVLKTGNAAEKLQAAQLLFDRFETSNTGIEIQTACPSASVIAETPNNKTAPETSELSTAQVNPVGQEPVLIIPKTNAEHAISSHNNYSDVDETILEECLDDLQLFITGNMPLEKARARLYPIIEPAQLDISTAKAILPEVIKQVSANHSKSLFVVKTE